MIYKVFWVIRALFLKPFFGRFLLPSYIGRPVYLRNISNVYIGKNVRVFPGARIEVIDSNSSIVIEDNVAIGQNLHITSGGNLVIGANSTILQNVMITNIDHDYTEINIALLQQKNIIRETSFGEFCFIGYGAVIQAGTILGKQCIVGANSVVRGTFPDYCVIVGAPARIVKRYDEPSKQWRRTDSKGKFIDEV